MQQYTCNIIDTSNNTDFSNNTKINNVVLNKIECYNNINTHTNQMVQW